jgi:FkbM family methyltransferase
MLSYGHEIMNALSVKLLQLKAFGSILRHFENPLIILLLRLGLIKLPYFHYRIRNQFSVSMLARPTTTSMADLFVLREVFVEEAYQDILSVLAAKNVRIVDVGSNIGSFTIWLNQRVGVREAFCFEPEPDSFRLLSFNLGKNGCRFAQAFPYAVGAEKRTIQISLKQDSPGGTSIYGNNSSSTGAAIDVIRFEEWLRGTTGDFDLLKLDCEGAEWEILQRTDPKQLTRFRVFVAEVHADPENKRSVHEFKMLMENLGFTTRRWDDKAFGLYVGVRKP